MLLQRYKRNPVNYNIKALAKAAKSFTGAEIEQAIVSTMFNSFADGGKDFNTKDLLAEVESVIPQAIINETELTAMRAEARGKLRLAADDGTVAEVAEEVRKISI